MTTLNITDAGITASNNASAGGILINVSQYKIGDSNQAHSASDNDIHGTELHAGNVSFIEVKSSNTSVFTFDVPEHVGTPQGVEINEAAVFLPGNVMYARAVFTTPFIKYSGRRLRIRALLSTVVCDLTTIDVTVGDYASVPSTAAVRNLPDPSSSEHNIVSVLDLHTNPDGTVSPGVAMRYGSGGNWGFMGYDRMTVVNPDNVTPTVITKNNLATTLGAVNGEIFIAQIVSNDGAYAIRKVQYNLSNDNFVEYDGVPWTNISTNSTIAFWKSVDNGGAVPGSSLTYPPDTANIPTDWVLTRGPSGIPVWAPPVECNGSLNTLYEEPSQLNFTTISVQGNDKDRRFTIGGLKPQNQNYIYPALGTVTQHRGAFDLLPGEVEFSEIIPSSVQVDLTVMTKTVSDGTKMEIFIDRFTGDGSTLRFPLSEPIDSVEYAWVFISGGRQSLTSYTYDSGLNELVFTEPPYQGTPVEAYCFKRVADPKYSTKVITTNIITEDNTALLELPISPQNKNMILISNQGVHVHSNLYSLSNNIVALSGVIPKGREIEIMIFDNIKAEGSVQTNLKGIVTDALVSAKTLTLLRHADLPVKLPIPGVDLEAGDGIRIEGIHPNFRIVNTVAERSNDAKPRNFNKYNYLEDAEEIVLTERVDIAHDMILKVSADFSAILGPGFVSEFGLESVQYSVGYRVSGQFLEPPYGRKIKGTGEAGFNSLVAASQENQKAFSNASINQSFNILKRNIPTGYIDVVVKMRLRESNVALYGSQLTINADIIVIPK